MSTTPAIAPVPGITTALTVTTMVTTKALRLRTASWEPCVT